MFNKKHTLNWPITDDKGQEVKDVVVSVLTMGQHRKFTKESNDDQEKLLRACVCASTGLSESELKRLTVPDYTSLENHVTNLMTASAKTLLNDANFDVDSPVLLVPFSGDDGLEKTTYKLKPPTVATTDLMDTHKDDFDKTIFISSSCTGFSQQELSLMSLPDWTQLQERLIDFLQKPADFFRQKT